MICRLLGVPEHSQYLSKSPVQPKSLFETRCTRALFYNGVLPDERRR